LQQSVRTTLICSAQAFAVHGLSEFHQELVLFFPFVVLLIPVFLLPDKFVLYSLRSLYKKAMLSIYFFRIVFGGQSDPAAALSPDLSDQDDHKLTNGINAGLTSLHTVNKCTYTMLSPKEV
jgi:hypothetical protein